LLQLVDYQASIQLHEALVERIIQQVVSNLKGGALIFFSPD